jgi:hypothetical protein
MGEETMFLRREKIHSILKSIRSGEDLSDSCARAGVSRHTIFLWKKRPAKWSQFWHVRLDRLLTIVRAYAEDGNNELVEKKMLKRLIDGAASSSEYFFYLCNRAPGRWRHVNSVTNVNQVNVVESDDKEFRNRFFMSKG